ncbi:MAG: hypothetical protein VX854_05960 [Candidatus Thermoplasmatota archaeon]|nr:hypothetical protein [Candidatus Thermoplasmatota archaeon]
MSGPTWVMLQCSSCDRFSGARKGQKSMICSHCGDRERLSVIQEFSNSSSLSQAISLENTPPEIRKELEKALSRKSKQISSPEITDPVSMIQSFTSDEGIIDVDGIISELISSGLSQNDSKARVTEWVEQSEIEGMVIRLPSGELILL